MPKKRTFDDVNAAIISALDIMGEYAQMGVTFASDNPRQSGKIECYSRSREESKPSAYVDVNTGRYGDSGGDTPETLSLWDFAAKYSTNPSFADWKAARAHFAKKAGVRLSAKTKLPDNPAEVLEFVEWSEVDEQRARSWCSKVKQGVTLEAIKAFGGRMAHYPCFREKDKETGKPKPDGKKRRGPHKVIAVPCWDAEHLTDRDPSAWVVWDWSGNGMKVYRGKGKEPDFVKMKSVGSTYGMLMNLQALEILNDPERREKVELVWKTGGPTDAMALWAAIPPDKRDTHLVVTNASSETGDVTKAMAAAFAGLAVIVVHDADKAGAAGVKKWQAALLDQVSELRAVSLRDRAGSEPWPVEEKKGKDLRDFLNGWRHGSEAGGNGSNSHTADPHNLF